MKAVKKISSSLYSSVFGENLRFRRNTVLAVKANVLAQVISFAFAPIITRMYSPADFGVLAVINSILSFFLSFSSLKLDWSIPNTRSRCQAFILLFVGLLTLSLVSSSLFVFVWFCDGRCTPYFQNINPFLWFLPVLLLTSGFQQLLQAWYVREANFEHTSKVRVYQSITGTISLLFGGFAKMGVTALIGSTLLSSLVGISILTYHARLKNLLRRLSFARLRSSLRSFWRDSVASTFVAIVNTASLTIVPFLLSVYYSATEVGWYAFMYRVVLTPVDVITSAISQSFWAEAANLIKYDRSGLRKLYMRTIRHLLAIAVLVALIALLGPFYVGFVFGEDWYRAGYVLAALAPLLLGHIAIPTLSHLVVHRKQHWQLIWDILRCAFLVVAIVVCSEMNMSIEITVLASSFVMLVMYLVLFWLNLVNLEVK